MIIFLSYHLIIVTSNSKAVLKKYVFWSLGTMAARGGLAFEEGIFFLPITKQH